MMAASAGEDGDTWEEAEGVPRIDDPFIAKYLQGRDALVAEEKKQRSGSWTLITAVTRII